MTPPRGWADLRARPWAAGGGLYLTAVVLLAGIARPGPDHLVVGAWAAALIAVAPSTVLVVPAIYLVVPPSWAISEHLHTGWPTTLAYMTCFAVGAITNVLLARRWTRSIVRRRAGHSDG